MTVGSGEFTSLMANVDVAGNVHIGSRCFLGSNATIVPGRRLGDDVTVGAGSVVVHHIKDGTKVFGNPAKRF